MSTTLKVLSAKKVIASHQINQGDTLVIDARDKSNYQLIDDQTGFGPQNIIAKREGKDLKIFLEDGDMNPDVVIKGYYGDENSEEVTNLIVGQHENGGIYAYVPESGLKADAVSMLAEEVAAPQALGGEDLASAFWAFNPWWLLALVPLAAGIAIAASNGGSSGSSNNGNNDNNDTTADKPEITANDNGSVTVKPGNDNTKVDVKFKDEDGNDKTVTAEKGTDGKWKLPENDDSGTTIDPDTGVITIPADKIKDGDTINAKGTDDKGNTADADAKTAGSNSATLRIPGDVDGDGDADDDDNDTTTEKGAPKVTIPEATDGVNAEEAKDGVQVEVSLPKNTKAGDTVKLTVTKPDGSTTTVDHVVTPAEEAAGKSTVTIPTADVGSDGDYKVVAKVTTPEGQESKPSAEAPFTVDQTPPATPDVHAEANGSVTVEPKDENPLTIKYTDETGAEKEFTVKKDDNGNWMSGDKPANVVVDPATGKVTIPATEVKDGSEVTATAKDPAGNTAEDTADAGNNPATPRVPGDVDGDGDADDDDNDATTEKGAPKVTIPEATDGVNAEEAKDGVQVEVSLPKNTKAGDTVKLTVTKPDGSTTTVDHVVTPAEEAAGKSTVTIPTADVGSDGDYKVVAKVTTPEGQESKPSAEAPFTVDQTPPATPDVHAEANGSVTVEPKDENPLTIKYTDETGAEKEFTVKKDDNGNWMSGDKPANVVVDPATGKVTIPATEVKDGSEVTATAKDPAGNTAEDTADAGNNPTPADPADKPVVMPSTTDGSVTVKPGDDNTKVVVEFIDEDAKLVTVTLTKKPDGTWESDNPAAYQPKADGSITIPQDNVKDRSLVGVKGTNEAGNSAYDSEFAGIDSKNAAVDPAKDGNGASVGVVSSTPADEGASIVTAVKLTNNNGNESLPFSLPNEAANGELSADDFADKSEFTFSNGVTQNPDGTLNVPAGVKEFTITTPVKADNTTEGEEKGKFTVGGVEGNEVTVNDTSLAPQNAQIDITQIAGDSQATDVTDDGSRAGDVYAQISPAEAAAGFLISGTSKDIAGKITVTIAEKGSSAIVTKTVTPKDDGTWSINVGANELTGYTSTKEYEVKAIGSSSNGTSVEDIDLTAATPQVTSIKLKDNLTDEPLVDGTYQYTNFYQEGDAKYVGDVSNADNLSAASSLATGLTNDKAAVLEFTLDKAPTAGQEVKVYRYTLSESSDANNPYTTHGKTEVTGDMVTTDGLNYTLTPKGDNVLGDTYSQNYRYEVVVKDKNGDELSTGAKGTFNFRLDTLVEQMSVEKFDITTGEVVFAPTGLSEVGATIEYRYATGSGTSGWDKATLGADGKYSLQLNNFNRKVPGALELRITDAAGNVSETKVSVLRNLTSVMNTEEGPDPAPTGSTIGAPITYGNGSMDDAAITAPVQPTTTTNKGAFVTTDGNDTVIFGLDFNKFGNLGVYNGTYGGTNASMIRGFDAGAGDDSVQFRGTLQSMYDSKIAMGAGNDRISIAGGLLVGKYTFDLGQADDVSGNTNILYVGGDTANAATINIYGGAGNDSVRIDGNFDGNKTVDLGDGNNELRVGYGTSGGEDLVKKIEFTSGSGDDSISVKGSISTIAGQTQNFNLGDGDNFIEVGKNVDTDGSFTFGSGVDTVNIKNTLAGGTFTFGAGNDSLTVGTIAKSAADNVKIDMGDGDDTITITGTRVNTGNGAINGGEGNDTIFLHGADLSLDMSQVLNVETIDMRAVTGGTGNQKVALTLADLQRNGDSVTKLYIKGDAGDTVDFGNNSGDGNNNAARDGANGKEYWNNGGTREIKNNWAVWEKTGSDIVENGVVYDKYTYKGATGEVNNEEVYIQQGIQII